MPWRGHGRPQPASLHARNDAPAAGGGLIGQIIEGSDFHRLIGDLDDGDWVRGASRTKLQLFPVFACGVFDRPLAHLQKEQNVCLGGVGGGAIEPRVGLRAAPQVAAIAAQFCGGQPV